MDLGEEDFYNAINKEEDTDTDIKDGGGSFCNSDDEEDEDCTGIQERSMSQDTTGQASSNVLSLGDHKEEEDVDMSNLGSIQDELDALNWDN